MQVRPVAVPSSSPGQWVPQLSADAWIATQQTFSPDRDESVVYSLADVESRADERFSPGEDVGGFQVLIWGILLGAVTAGAVLFVGIRWNRIAERAFVLAVSGTVLGLVVCVAAYLWLFDRTTCAGRSDISCVLNANQGVIATLAVFLTVTGLWIAAISRRADTNRDRIDKLARAEIALASSAEEIHHNLMHIALAFDDEGVCHANPQLSTAEMRELCRHEYREFVHPSVVESVHIILRNQDRLNSHTFGDRVWRRAMDDLIGNSLSFLLRANGHHHQAISKIAHLPGMQDFAKVQGQQVYHATRTSSLEDHASQLRNHETPVVCWIDDGKIPGVTAYSQRQHFIDMSKRSH